MLKRILVPVDMSACSLAALRYGAFLGEHSGAELYVLHVARSFDNALDSAEQLGGASEPVSGAAPIRDFLQDGGRTIIKEAHVEVICGDVSAAILRAAAQHEVDIIVMGSHGEGDTHGSIIGHVVKDVAQKALCAVVPIFEPAQGAGHYSLCASADASVTADMPMETAALVEADAELDEASESRSAPGARPGANVSDSAQLPL